MDEKSPKVLINSGMEIHTEWNETRAAEKANVELPPPPSARVQLDGGKDDWLLDQFKSANRKSDELVLGQGFDQLKARTEAHGADCKALHLLNQRWEFSDFRIPEGRSSAFKAVDDILQAYNFPRVGELPSGLEIAWAWRGEALCWAHVPSGARIEAPYPGDPISTFAEKSRQQTNQATRKPAYDTWNSVVLSPRFHELLPPAAPIHWALAVQALLAALTEIEAAAIDEASSRLMLKALRASFDAGAKATEFEARRFSTHVEEWDRTTAARQQMGAHEAERRTREAEERWYTVTLDWLDANMDYLCVFGLPKIYDELIAADLNAQLPDLPQFEVKFREWENEGRFTPRLSKGKPCRPRKTR
ncbi:MAG: hypothetical protein RIA71_14305 [Oceanicaulis sp.]